MVAVFPHADEPGIVVEPGELAETLLEATQEENEH